MKRAIGFPFIFFFSSKPFLPALGVVVPAFAVDDAVERLQELDFDGDYVVGGRGAAVHADALQLRPVLDAVVRPVAGLPHEPVGHRHGGRGVHHDHAVRRPGLVVAPAVR